MVQFRVGSAQNTLNKRMWEAWVSLLYFSFIQYYTVPWICLSFYKNIDHMWLPMMMILKQISSSVTPEAIEAQKGMIIEFSILSHLFQEENKLQFHVKKSSETVYKNVERLNPKTWVGRYLGLIRLRRDVDRTQTRRRCWSHKTLTGMTYLERRQIQTVIQL